MSRLFFGLEISARKWGQWQLGPVNITFYKTFEIPSDEYDIVWLLPLLCCYQFSATVFFIAAAGCKSSGFRSVGSVYAYLSTTTLVNVSKAEQMALFAVLFLQKARGLSHAMFTYYTPGLTAVCRVPKHGGALL